MSNPKWDEQILVVAREDLFKEVAPFQGIHTIDSIHESDIYKLILNVSNSYKFMRRGNEKDPTPAEFNAEINSGFKQIIPYCVIRRGNEYFTYKRLSGGGETRLFDKYSIGVGGHMNDVEQLVYDSVEVSFGLILDDNISREIQEELTIETEGLYSNQVEIFGVLNDESDSVGSVHFGIVIIIDLDEDTAVEVNEKEQLEGEWMTLEQLLEAETFNKLENWSKITVDALS